MVKTPKTLRLKTTNGMGLGNLMGKNWGIPLPKPPFFSVTYRRVGGRPVISSDGYVLEKSGPWSPTASLECQPSPVEE